MGVYNDVSPSRTADPEGADKGASKPHGKREQKRLPPQKCGSSPFFCMPKRPERSMPLQRVRRGRWITTGKSSGLWVTATAGLPRVSPSDVKSARAIQIQRRLRTGFSPVSFFSAPRGERHLCFCSKYSIISLFFKRIIQLMQANVKPYCGAGEKVRRL